MKRILQLATIFFVSAVFILPLLEYFDRWDAPGLGNDTELPAFLTVLLVTLVLLAVMALARRFFECQSHFTVTEGGCETLWRSSLPVKFIVLVPFIIPPLRI